jgi:hypothetical protein
LANTHQVFPCVTNQAGSISVGSLDGYLAALSNALGTSVEVEWVGTVPYLVLCGSDPDSDGDGIPDDDDACPDSDLGPSIVIGSIDTGVANLWMGDQTDEDGCSLADHIACALRIGAVASVDSVKAGFGIQGQFRASMAQYFESLVILGIITGAEKDLLQSAVAGIPREDILELAALGPC